MITEKMVIAIDFDGTCVKHRYPHVGEDIGAVPVLKKLVENGHKLILYTMRSSLDNGLNDALNWFRNNDIPLYGIQRNPTQDWTNSPKCFANLYIDDAALGIPLIHEDIISQNYDSYVDWKRVELELKNLGVIK